jgi:tetratricopeptide (TPR) repeat protein
VPHDPPGRLPSVSDAAFQRLVRIATREGDEDARLAMPPQAFEASRRDGQIFGRFVLMSELGRGGSSVVWRSWQIDLRRYVALKILKGCNPVLRERFLLEARVTAGLSHPGILPVYESGEREGALFIAMPVVGGASLDRCSLPPLQAAAVVAEAARTVAAAHAAGVIHRDLKPSNLMRDGNRVYVMDFGLAKILDAIEGITFHGDVLGTPSFMAPEQAFGGPLDARTDVYGLGATLFAVVTGRTPYAGSTVPEFVDALQFGRPPGPGSMGDLPPGLEGVILRALSRRPEDRQPSALALADELDRVARGEAVEASVPGSGIRRPATSVALPGAARPPLFGRDAELAHLLESARAGGFVVVVGEAGAGKTHLLAEAARRLRSESPARAVRLGEAHERSAAPLEVMGGVAGAAESAGHTTALVSRFSRDLESVSPSALERDNLAHLLAHSLGARIPGTRVRHLEPAALRRETRRAWETWLRARARACPLTLVLENLHWADPATLSLLEYLAVALRPSPVSILASSRFWSSLPRGFTGLPLERLPDRPALALAESVLGRSAGAEVAEMLIRESRGNPAHLVELATWLEREGHLEGDPARPSSRTGAPPSDYAGLLAARFRALSPEERRVLAAGSILGPRFGRAALEHALDAPADSAIDALGRAGVLDLPPSRHGGGGFRDPALRDAAYALVPEDERRRLHARAAESLERDAHDGSRRSLAMAGAQWEAAACPAEAARAWLAAARRAEEEASPDDALPWSREAARLGRTDAAMIEAEALLNLARYDELLALAERHELPADTLHAYRLAASKVCRRLGNCTKALELATGVLDSGATGDIRLQALGSRASALIPLGRLDEASANIAEGRSLADELARVLPWRAWAARVAGLRALEGIVLTSSARWADALEPLRDSARMSREIGDRKRLATAMSNIGGALSFQDRFEEGFAAWREAGDIFREIGDRHGIAMVHRNISSVLLTAGRPEDAAREAQCAVEIQSAIGERSALAASLGILARAWRKLGREKEADEAHAKAEAVLRERESEVH